MHDATSQTGPRQTTVLVQSSDALSWRNSAPADELRFTLRLYLELSSAMASACAVGKALALDTFDDRKGGIALVIRF
jgi:hypothetical protein